MGTKNNPGMFDYYAAAEPDEPMFVLLARDPLAPILVEIWATLRAQGCSAHPERSHSEKAAEAKQCAQAMRAYKLVRDCAGEPSRHGKPNKTRKGGLSMRFAGKRVNK